jgi:hypothetical protein
MLKNNIGSNAGIVWDFLFKKGAMSARQIAELTGLNEIAVTLALGWLAREDKIKFYEEHGTVYIDLKSNPDFQDMYW